ncbi:hypothetical protein LSAT2_012758 [Lamellibrachia satsuma]|nr:hypothetical protein LSAT2_012758 [Lamellibrachia satsuma]
MSTSGELAMAILCLLGVITVKGDTIQVGNEIKESSNVFSSGGRAFLLQLVFPADGIVVAWTSYYQNTRPASYQIWRPVGGANNSHFQLVHDVVVMPTTKLAEETTPYYAIKNASCIEVKSGDRVGIFIRKVPGSTTFLYDINAKTLMNKYSDPSLYPALGDLVTFDPLAMPLYFSLRLDLDIAELLTLRFCGANDTTAAATGHQGAQHTSEFSSAVLRDEVIIFLIVWQVLMTLVVIVLCCCMCRRPGHRVDVCGSTSNILARELTNEVDSDGSSGANATYYAKDKHGAAGVGSSDA